MNNNSINIYLAGPFFSKEQINRLKIVKESLENNKDIGYIFEPLENQNKEIISKYGDGDLTKAMRTKEWQVATFNSDVRQINTCDVVVAILDYKVENNNDSSDEGTIWEIGYAHAMNKPVILVQFNENNQEPLNLMLTMYTAYFKGEIDIRNNLSKYNFLSLPYKESTREIL